VEIAKVGSAEEVGKVVDLKDFIKQRATSWNWGILIVVGLVLYLREAK
jgi:hypothetical protein